MPGKTLAAMPVDSLGPEDRIVLQQMRRGAQSRADLAERTGQSRNTVAARLTRLEAAGWVVETADTQGDRGRPFTRYGLNPFAALIFTARFDRDHINAAICALTGEVLATASRESVAEADPDTAIGLLNDMIGRMTTQTGIRRERLAAGVIGVPGPVSELARTIVWSGVGVLPIDLSERLGMITLVENDANLMALGAAQGIPESESLLFILVQTFIGGGLVLNGRLHRGASGWAGEIGHIPVAAAAGRPCTCGNIGCLANIADNRAMMQAISTPDRPVTTEDALRLLVINRDVDAIMALRQAGRTLGEAISPLAIGLAPDTIMVGGPIVSVGDHFATGVRESLSQRTAPALSSLIRVTTTDHFGTCAILGSVELSLDHLLGRSASTGMASQAR